MNFRPAALATGPISLLAFALFITAVVVDGAESDLALARSPIASASSVIGMVGLILLLMALIRIMGSLEPLQDGVGRAGAVIALIGTALASGGQWSIIFVVPGLARMDDATAEATTAGIPLVVAGFIVSFVILAIGWLLIAVALLRSQDVPRKAAIFLLVGAILCIAPLPMRFFVIALAVTTIEMQVSVRRISGPTPASGADLSPSGADSA